MTTRARGCGRRRRRTTDPAGARSGRRARAAAVPSPRHPCRSRGAGRPCRDGPAATRGARRGRTRPAQAPPGRADQRARARRSSPAPDSRAGCQASGASRPQSPPPSADRPGSADPCSAARAQRDDREAWRANDADRRRRAGRTRTWGSLLPSSELVPSPTTEHRAPSLWDYATLAAAKLAPRALERRAAWPMMRADRCARHRPSASRQDRRLARRRRPLRSRHLLARRHDYTRADQAHQTINANGMNATFRQELGDMRTVRLGPLARDAMVLVGERYASAEASRSSVSGPGARPGRRPRRSLALDTCASNQRDVDTDRPRPRHKPGGERYSPVAGVPRLPRGHRPDQLEGAGAPDPGDASVSALERPSSLRPL